jgi:arsenate reductase
MVACPFIAGEKKGFPSPLKIETFDNTTQQEEKYHERSMQIVNSFTYSQN